MTHRRFEFDMPAPSDVVFDAFHYHVWRARWDSLVSDTRVVGGAPCPFVGAETENAGGGLLRACHRIQKTESRYRNGYYIVKEGPEQILFNGK